MGLHGPFRVVLFLSRRHARVDFFYRCTYLSRTLHAGEGSWSPGFLLLGSRHRRPRHLGLAALAQLSLYAYGWDYYFSELVLRRPNEVAALIRHVVAIRSGLLL